MLPGIRAPGERVTWEDSTKGKGDQGCVGKLAWALLSSGWVHHIYIAGTVHVRGRRMGTTKIVNTVNIAWEDPIHWRGEWRAWSCNIKSCNIKCLQHHASNICNIMHHQILPGVAGGTVAAGLPIRVTLLHAQMSLSFLTRHGHSPLIRTSLRTSIIISIRRICIA